MFDKPPHEITNPNTLDHLVHEIAGVREQLRIANLIALAGYINGGPWEDHYLADAAHDAIDALTHLVTAHDPDDPDLLVLQAPIAAALGIGLPQPRTDINTAPDPTWEDHEAVWRRTHPRPGDSSDE